MIKIGDFVTQYSAGYWQLIDIKPKFAEDKMYEKIEIAGQWAVLKKAFTPKMKPKIEFDYADASWLSPVSDDVLNNIKQYFSDNPDFKSKFDNTPLKLNHSITTCWLDLPAEEEEAFRQLLAFLPPQYTMDEFWGVFKEYKKYIGKPPAAYLLNFATLPWYIDSKGNRVYTGCTLVKS